MKSKHLVLLLLVAALPLLAISTFAENQKQEPAPKPGVTGEHKPSAPIPNKDAAIDQAPAPQKEEAKESPRPSDELALKLKWVDFWIGIPGVLASIILAIIGSKKTEAGSAKAGGAITGLGAFLGFGVVLLLFVLLVLPRRLEVPSSSASERDLVREEIDRSLKRYSYTNQRAERALESRKRAADDLAARLEDLRQGSATVQEDLNKASLVARELLVAKERGMAEFPTQSVLLNHYISLDSAVGRTRAALDEEKRRIHNLEAKYESLQRIALYLLLALILSIGLLCILAWYNFRYHLFGYADHQFERLRREMHNEVDKLAERFGA